MSNDVYHSGDRLYDKTFYQCAFVGLFRKCEYFSVHGYGMYKIQ